MARKCPQCDSDNPDTATFCADCGTRIISTKEIDVTKTIEAPKEKLATGATFAGRYEITEELGKGGMGTVYKAFDKELGEEVALKLIKPEIAADEKTIERFKNELKLARKIGHRNVGRMYELMEAEGKPFITMEFVEGEDLKSHLRREERLSTDEAVSLAKQVCEGLSEAHRLGVVHRDLKPQNIMIDKEGHVKIMDFGIARSLKAKGVTQTGMIIGTPDYMSPEQADGKEADERSDVYSLGIILYEMVTGRVPFEGDSSLSVALKHKAEMPPDPREIHDHVSDEMSQLILKCMEKERERRYQSIEELFCELENIKQGISVDMTPSQSQIPAFLLEEKFEEERQVFVAREKELLVLGEYLNKAISGKGKVVFVEGEAGSGKTALVQEFTRRAQEEHPYLIAASGKCNAQTGIGDPYFPFIEILSLLTGNVEVKWAAGAITREHALRLWNCLPLSVKALLDKGQELIDVFIPGAELVNRAEAFASGGANWLLPLKKLVERKAGFPPDSQLQQVTLFEQYTRVLELVSRQKPLLLVLDDLQWADAGSVSLLFHLGRRIKESPVLIVGAFRPAEVSLGRAGERHPLEAVLHEFKRDFGDIELEVDKAEGRPFVDAFLDTEPNKLDKAFRKTLFRLTKGHPLFTVELLRSMQERGILIKNEKGEWLEGTELKWDLLPARVDAVIEERIGRLSEKLKDILSLASVEGEEFTAEVVARLQDSEVGSLVRLLSHELDKRHHLVTAKGIKRLASQRLSLYLFQHILFQRYLYNNLDDVERSHLHEKVGKILESLYGDQVYEIAVQQARHFEEAGIPEKVVEYLQQAGDKALRLSANEEAIGHYKKCLDVLKTQEVTPGRIQQELTLLLSFYAALTPMRGYGNPEVLNIRDRSLKLCEQADETPQLLLTLGVLGGGYSLTADYHTAVELGERALRIAEKTGDPVLKVSSYGMLIWPLVNIAEFDRVLEYTEYMIDLYNPEQYFPLAYTVGFDLGELARTESSWVLWFLGYPDQALSQINDGLSLARELGHPHSLVHALTFAIEFFWFLRDYETVNKYAEELLLLSTERGYIYWRAHGIFYLGERKILDGKVKEGIEQMHQAIGIMHASGTVTCLTRLNARLAEACLKTNQPEEGLAAVEEGFKAFHAYGEIYYESELHRLKGELILKNEEQKEKAGNHKKVKSKDGVTKKTKEAETCFQKAIEVSRKLKAKSLELRAVMSLSRLYQKQGKKQEALKMLDEIYCWFTEGFDTADLKEAKTLLKDLS